MNRKIIFAAAALAAVVTLGTVAGNTVLCGRQRKYYECFL